MSSLCADDYLKSQLYMVKFFKKTDKNKKIVYISIDVTTFKDVKVAAKLLRDANNLAAEALKRGETTIGCSYKHLFVEGYDFNPEDVEVLGIYGNNETTGHTLKTFARVVTKSKCYHLPKMSLERMENCEQTLLDQLKAFLSKMPQRNQTYFNTQAWKQQSGEIEDFEPEDTFSPKRARVE